MTRQDKAVRAPKAARGIFAEFKDDPDPEVRQRASNWSVAIGLQDVDLLSVSQFLIDTAKRNIRGEITQEEVAWRRRIGCGDAGHVFDPGRRKVATRLLVDDGNPSQKAYLLELVDNPVGVKAIVPAG